MALEIGLGCWIEDLVWLEIWLVRGYGWVRHLVVFTFGGVGDLVGLGGLRW